MPVIVSAVLKVPGKEDKAFSVDVINNPTYEDFEVLLTVLNDQLKEEMGFGHEHEMRRMRQQLIEAGEDVSKFDSATKGKYQ